MQATLYMPVMALVWVTIVVWFYLYARRIGYLSSQNIDAQQLATPEKVNALLPESVNNSSNNLKNLFEIPVLFYVVCLLATSAGVVGSFETYAAWLYVLLRALHSVIQCTYNRVNHRFAAYALSCLVMWALAGSVFLSLM